MAFYSQEEDDENNQFGQGAQIGPQSGQVGTNTSLGGQKGDSSGSFVGIKKYIDANRDQSAKLGDQAAGIINDSSGQARNAVTGLSNKFKSAADQGTVNLDQDATNLAAGSAEKLSSDQQNKVKNQYNASYAGPNSLADFNDDYLNAQKAVNQAQANVQQQGSEAGRIGLAKQINQQAGKQSRTSGGLDNLLLQTGGGKEKLQAAADANKDIPGTLQSAQTAAQQEASQAKSTTDATKQATRSAIGQMDDPSTPQDESAGAFGDLKNYLQGKANTATGQYNQGYSAAANRQITPELASQLGVNPDENFYNVDLGQYVNKNPQEAAWNTVAGQDDVARYQALANIAGQDPNALSQGEYKPYVIDKGAVRSGLDSAKKNYEDYTTLKSPEGRKAIGDINAAFNNGAFGGSAALYGFDKVTDVDSARAALDKWANAKTGNGKTNLEVVNQYQQDPKYKQLLTAYDNLKKYASNDTEQSFLQLQSKNDSVPVPKKGKA